MAYYTDLESPIGVSGFASVVRENKTFGGYSIQLFLDPNEKTTEDFIEDLQRRFNASIEAEKREHPNAKIRDLKIDKVTEKDPKDLQGKEYVKITFKSKIAPKVFDANGAPLTLDREIGIGSKVRLGITTRSYTFANTSGMTLYVNSVYVLEQAVKKAEEFNGNAAAKTAVAGDLDF